MQNSALHGWIKFRAGFGLYRAVAENSEQKASGLKFDVEPSKSLRDDLAAEVQLSSLPQQNLTTNHAVKFCLRDGI